MTPHPLPGGVVGSRFGVLLALPCLVESGLFRICRKLYGDIGPALCEILDKTATIFPGSRRRIRFAMRPPRRIGLAFPGSASSVGTRPSRPGFLIGPETDIFDYPMSGDLN